MTNQEAFTKAKEHMLKQMQRSMCPTNEFLCVYRGRDGLKCPVGALIPDEIYKSEMEGKNVSVLIQHHPIIAELFKNVNIDLLSRLQGIHDCVSPSNWKIRLQQCAIHFNLQFE